MALPLLQISKNERGEILIGLPLGRRGKFVFWALVLLVLFWFVIRPEVSKIYCANLLSYKESLYRACVRAGHPLTIKNW